MTAAPEAPSQAGGFREIERSDLDTRGEKMAALRQAPSGDTRAAFREAVRPVFFFYRLSGQCASAQTAVERSKMVDALGLADNALVGANEFAHDPFCGDLVDISCMGRSDTEGRRNERRGVTGTGGGGCTQRYWSVGSYHYK